MKFTAVDMYLMDIGTPSSTEYDFNDTSWINAFDENPDLMGLKIGQIHSHQSMDCFFSSTDIGHLHECSPFHNYFVSLIVNFACEPIAKVAFTSTRKITSSFSFKDDSGNLQYQEEEKEEELTVVFDCEVLVEIEPKLLNRIDELKEAKNSAAIKWNANKQNYIHNDFRWEDWKKERDKEPQATIWNTNGDKLNIAEVQGEFDFDSYKPVVTDKKVEYFIKCLLADNLTDYDKSIALLVEDRNACVDTNEEARNCCLALHMMYDSIFHSDTYFTEVMVKAISIFGKHKNDFTTKMISIIKQEMKEYANTEI